MRRVRFESSYHPALPIEIVDGTDLTGRMPHQALRTPEHADFVLFIVVESGQGRNQVDFTEIDLQPGRLIRIAPNQVHTWELHDELVLTLVLVSPEVPEQQKAPQIQPQYLDLDIDSLTTARAIIDALRCEQHRFNDSPAATDLMLNRAGSWKSLYRRAQQPKDAGFATPEAYLAFINSREADPAASRSPTHYTHRIRLKRPFLRQHCQNRCRRGRERRHGDHTL